MEKYHKIQSVYKRDPETKFKTLLEGEWSEPVFGYLANAEWYWKEKVDGMNMRVHWDGTERKIFGRSQSAQIHPELYERMQELFPVEKLSNYPPGTSFYGEGYGAGIQKGGGNYRDNKDFILFDVNIDGYWLQWANVLQIANAMSLDYVPLIGVGSLYDAIDFCRRGFDSYWGDFRAEGLVCVPTYELSDRNGDRIITKIKCKDFDHDR